MSQSSNIAVVILNYNGRHWLEKFLPSVIEHSERAEIIIVDNGSTDDSFVYLNKKYPTIKTIVLDQNYGFTGGYNRGLKELNHQYFVLLNSDIEVTPNWLDAPIDLLNDQLDVAAVQPKIKSYHHREMFEHAGAAGGMIDRLGYPFCRGRIFMTAEEDTGQYEEEQEVFWATGACLFIRGSLYKSFGGLQEEFFAHMEEIDLCWRLKRAGHRIMYTPHSHVYHVGGGTLAASNPRKTYLNFRNGMALLYINLPNRKLIPIILSRLVLDGIAAVQFTLVGHWRDAWAIFRAHMSFYRRRSTWKKARINSRKMSVQDVYPSTYKRSIVWQYFLRNRTEYRELPQ